MKIKNKLILGISFLFAVILLIGGLGSYFTYQLSENSQNMISENLNSIDYANSMLQSIDNIKEQQLAYFFNKEAFDAKRYEESVATFEKELSNEEKNITETGEKELVLHLSKNFKAYTDAFEVGRHKTKATSEYYFSAIHPTYQIARMNIFQVSEINRSCIVKKSKISKELTNKAFRYMAIICSICFLITLSFIVNFPEYIANPIKELTENIKQIANKNYNSRLNFKSNDEFGELAIAFNTMAVKLNEYENSNLASILVEKKRIEAIIQHMTDGVIGIDQNKQIVFINLEALKLLKMPQKEISNHSVTELAEKSVLLKKLFSEENSNDIKVTERGKEAFYSKDSVNIMDNEKVIGQVIIIRNITSFKERDLAKSNFIATISHELKTPISSIKMSLMLLENDYIGKVNPEQYQLIQNIKEDSNRLLKITGELLNLTQVETGNIQLNIQAIEPIQIVDYAIQATKAQSEQKNINVLVDIANFEMPKILADPEKTTWVMVNILSNAIRYSPENSEVLISVVKREHSVEFTVKDTGAGIESKYKDKVFERYFQVPGSDAVGTGLGLAISKEFIEGQNGNIWVESEIGQGSKFCFTLNAQG